MYGSVYICMYRLLREIYALSTQGDNIHVVRVANACQHSHAKSHTDKSIIQELTFAYMPARPHKHTHTHMRALTRIQTRPYRCDTSMRGSRRTSSTFRWNCARGRLPIYGRSKGRWLSRSSLTSWCRSHALPGSATA